MLSAVASRDGALQRAGLVASQVIGLATCRHILGFQALLDMDDETLIQRVAPTLQRYLTEPW